MLPKWFTWPWKRAAGVVLALLLGGLPTTNAWGSPFCGGISHVSPPSGTLPPGATIAAFLEDRYVGGELLGHATRRTRNGAYDGTTDPIGKYWATLDGKRVATSTKDVVVADGILRFITIKSRKVGTLVLWTKGMFGGEDVEVATYQVSATWEAGTNSDSPANTNTPKNTATSNAVTVSAERDLRMAVYRYVGNLAQLELQDTATIAVRMKWRANSKQPWHSLVLPVRNSDEYGKQPKQVAWVGELVCGMTRNLAPALLQTGIEVQLSAQRVDGSTVNLTSNAPLTLQMTWPDKRKVQ